MSEKQDGSTSCPVKEAFQAIVDKALKAAINSNWVFFRNVEGGRSCWPLHKSSSQASVVQEDDGLNVAVFGARNCTFGRVASLTPSWFEEGSY
ncbi:hypothetical protein [Streptomyces sp. NBC_01236]|uniref:hypothetical protein n=1 Tax=Streptomyces sp. NBC_01236 TaxID=2903789 RepID=UPI002E0ED689|nr:hypothetical protein OG324_33945 [Streptomyces sp. NBC_01236]